MTGMSAEDINGYWENPATGHRYVTILGAFNVGNVASVSYTHLRAHETVLDLVCRLLLEKKKNNNIPHCSQL